MLQLLIKEGTFSEVTEENDKPLLIDKIGDAPQKHLTLPLSHCCLPSGLICYKIISQYIYTHIVKYLYGNPNTIKTMYSLIKLVG